MNDTTRIWIHRTRAIGWIITGALSFLFGFAHSITIVWIASLYANVVSDWTAGEAADNREIMARLDHLEQVIIDNTCTCHHPT